MAKPANATVYTVAFQLRETANTVAVYSSKAKALEHARRNFAYDLLTSGANEYPGETAELQKRLMRTPDLRLEVRDKGDEVWIDLSGPDGKSIQPAVYTITRLQVDGFEPEAELEEKIEGEDAPLFIHPEPKGRQ